MTKAEQMREKVCNILAPENEIMCQKVAEMSQCQASAEIGLGALPYTCLKIIHPGLPDTGKSEV